jgi:tryptophan-rich sensory protein
MSGIASRSQLRMSFLRYALVTVPLVLLLGTLSGTLAGSGYGNPWFDALAKPDLMPPGWVFGAAWTLLYICLGLALALILHARGARGRGVAVGIFLAQLLLNFAWSPIFFAAHEIGLAFLVIVVMMVLSALAALLFARIRRAAGLLMVPYLAWLFFAAFLNWQIGQMNPNADQLVPPQASADIPL